MPKKDAYYRELRYKEYLSELLYWRSLNQDKRYATSKPKVTFKHRLYNTLTEIAENALTWARSDAIVGSRSAVHIVEHATMLQGILDSTSPLQFPVKEILSAYNNFLELRETLTYLEVQRTIGLFMDTLQYTNNVARQIVLKKIPDNHRYSLAAPKGSLGYHAAALTATAPDPYGFFKRLVDIEGISDYQLLNILQQANVPHGHWILCVRRAAESDVGMYMREELIQGLKLEYCKISPGVDPEWFSRYLYLFANSNADALIIEVLRQIEKGELNHSLEESLWNNLLSNSAVKEKEALFIRTLETALLYNIQVASQLMKSDSAVNQLTKGKLKPSRRLTHAPNPQELELIGLYTRMEEMKIDITTLPMKVMTRAEQGRIIANAYNLKEFKKQARKLRNTTPQDHENVGLYIQGRSLLESRKKNK